MLLSKKPILILCVSLFVVMIGFGIVIPVMPFFATEIGATPFEIGLLMASYSLMQFLFSPLWGEVSDKIGRKPVIIIGIAGFSVSFILFGLARTVPLLFASRILAGILSSATLPTSMAYVGDITDEHERGGGMGIMSAAMNLGMIMGPVIGGIFGRLGFAHPFFIAAALGFITLPFAFLFLPESLKGGDVQPKRASHFQHIANLSELMMILYALVFIMMFSLACLQSTFPLFSADKFRMGPYEMGIIFGIMGLVGVLIQGFIIGWLIDRFGEHQMIRCGFLLAMLGFALIIVSTGIFDLVLYTIIVGVGIALLTPSLSSIISKESSFGQGAALGLMNSFMSLGRVFGPFTGGLLFGFGWNLPYVAGSVALLLGLIASIFFLEPSA